jgi:hypothetical protein
LSLVRVQQSEPFFLHITKVNDMETFIGVGVHGARAFAERWLPAWTGNNPDRLLAFYSNDAHYSDPGVPNGIQGHEALRGYFVKLLRRNPDWRWTQTGSIPMLDGFVNLWHAHVPVGDGRSVDIAGCCLVHLRDGLIFRNEVFFDRTSLLREQ